jgi:hypothetical protein
MSTRIVFALLAAVVPAQALAQPLALAPALRDDAVLQRGEPLAIADRAAPDAAVTVTLGDCVRSVRADAAGDWLADCPAMPAATGLTLTATSGDERVIARNLAVGERRDIHPPLKKPVGQRMATALGVLRFGEPREALGPRRSAMCSTKLSSPCQPSNCL